MSITPPTAIAVDDVSFSYGATPVLEHLSFAIAAGDYVGLAGPNGSGKTTLLHLFLGLRTPTAGTVRIFGHDPATAQRHREIGYVPQRIASDEAPFPATVGEVVASGRTPRLLPWQRFGSKDTHAVAAAMERTDIIDLRNRRIGTLSGGQRQRVAIARALAGEPALLVLDEPTVGVDLATQDAFYEFLQRLNTEMGMTILLVSHDIETLLQRTRTILCLAHRQAVCHAATSSFSKEEYVKTVFGKHASPMIPHHDHFV